MWFKKKYTGWKATVEVNKYDLNRKHVKVTSPDGKTYNYTITTLFENEVAAKRAIKKAMRVQKNKPDGTEFEY